MDNSLKNQQLPDKIKGDATRFVICIPSKLLILQEFFYEVDARNRFNRDFKKWAGKLGVEVLSKKAYNAL